MTLFDLQALCASHARTAIVRRTRDARPHWRIEGSTAYNTQADFFRIRGVDIPGAGRRLMLEQRDPALVMLLCVDTPGQGRKLVLSLRNEPGLIGGTNLSSTIQSTPANHQRRHGGGATPFIELVDGPRDGARVLWDCQQYDWGDCYLGKTKRYLILTVTGPIHLPEGLVPVDDALAPALLMSDHLITNDLRVCLGAYLALERFGHAPGAAGEPLVDIDTIALTPVDLETFRTPGAEVEYRDDAGWGVSYYEVISPTREVPKWRQPLMRARSPLTLALGVKRMNGSRAFAVRQATQPGLGGARLWFPAAAALSNTSRTVATSGEGGRFFRRRITLSLASAVGAAEIGPEAARWVTLADLSRLCLAPRTASLELRFLWSLALSDA